jgi:hypothetical protein
LDTQRTELVDANRVKKILEKTTDGKYTLKTRNQLVHPDNIAWYLHLPVGTAGHISQAYEVDDKLVLETPILYEVFQDTEHSFSESDHVRLRHRLGDDVGHLQDRDVREKYRKVLPQVVTLFDKVEEILSEINQERSTNLSLVNSKGSLTIKVQMGTREAEMDELVTKNVLALKKAIHLIANWQDEQRVKKHS